MSIASVGLGAVYLGLLGCSLPMTAQAPTTTAGKPPVRVAILAGRLLDVRTGSVATNRYILVESDRIVSIGAAAPAGVAVIDLSAHMVLPGLADCHAHILGNQKDQSPAGGLRMSSPMAALWGVHNLQIWLDHGFTSLRDPGESDAAYGQIALRDAIRKGLIRGPRIVSSGNFISITGGHGDNDPLAPDQALPRRPNIANTVDQVSDAVRYDIKYGADWIKLMATGGVLDPFSDYRMQELSEEQMTRAVEVAHRAGKRVMVEKGRAILAAQQPAFTLALGHHLKIAYGVDEDPDFSSKEFSALVRGGMTPLGALQAATVNAAELMGTARDTGTVEAGKFADLIAISGDPLKDITVMEQVVFVMKGGEVVKDEVHPRR